LLAWLTVRLGADSEQLAHDTGMMPPTHSQMISAKGPKMSSNGKHRTAADHMPSSHRRYTDWTMGRIRRDATLIGPNNRVALISS
jgi:hypothetical protein